MVGLVRLLMKGISHISRVEEVAADVFYSGLADVVIVV